MGLRITTWNVNGIRNPFGYQPWRENKTFNYMFDILEADIVIMQELKIQRKDLRDDMVLVPGWDCYFSLPKHKKGYSGVGIYTRQSKCAPIRAEEGLLGVLSPPGSSIPYRDLPEEACIGGYPTALQVADLGVDPAVLDAEGRCLVVEFPAFVLFGVYSPANSNGLRDDFRYGFLCALDTRIRNLAKLGKRVVLTGDLNVSREEIDTARAEEAMRAEGITHEEYLSTPNRRIFNQLLEGGKVPGQRDEGREDPVLWDICRGFHENRVGMYTHWEQKINARPANFGSRIDYILCSIEMKSWFSESNIQEGLMGSDHCPVYAVMKDKVELGGEQANIYDIMNPPGMFKEGRRLRDFSPAKDLLSLSGKLLPEFDRRRSIKDMFTRKPMVSSNSPSMPLSAKLCDHNIQAQNSEELQPTEVKRSRRGGTASVSTKAQTFTSPVNSSAKRPSDNSPAAKPAKRSKSNTTPSTAQTSSKGQQSLKGFFIPKSTISKPTNLCSGREVCSTAKSPKSSVGDEGSLNTTAPKPTLGHSGPPSVSPPGSNVEQESALFTDPQATKESWTKLFSRKPSPRCEHNEPCVIYTTKKPGVNCGRQFFICPRPIGPTGNKEKGTEWRCGTFIWASDWNSSGNGP
ncbi:DNase I-like protein [Delitschia confertaspora ATCC 74209]|uniref:DNA-(apurinic or apyrimidinic site) endonuclease 2 n=1 Tax=Delitschia confertaspora ATCC 74209 TaxID=1513339 RepID=A0A9P4JU15_9PLEO|nr:DNase I-like protein [Delitschia confertaspora ATCC 74209]